MNFSSPALYGDLCSELLASSPGYKGDSMTGADGTSSDQGTWWHRIWLFFAIVCKLQSSGFLKVLSEVKGYI